MHFRYMTYMWWSASIRTYITEKPYHYGIEEAFGKDTWHHQDMDTHIEQTHQYGPRVRLDFPGFMKSKWPHNGNSVSRCEYVAQRYVGDTALIEPFNSVQRLLTIPMCSNMILNGNFQANAEIWRWKQQFHFNHLNGTFDLFAHRSNGFIFCDEAFWPISSSHVGSI